MSTWIVDGTTKVQVAETGRHLDEHGLWTIEYMPVEGLAMITDELRDAIETATKTYEDLRNPYNDREICHIAEEHLKAIADRIDKEHEKATSEFLTKSGGVPATDESMAKHGWFRLPTDADGVPIRIGDRVTEHEDGHTFTVDGFMHWGVDDDLWVFENYGIQAPAKNCTHAVTAEDVLRQFAIACEDAGNAGPEIERLVSEYAERLELKDRS